MTSNWLVEKTVGGLHNHLEKKINHLQLLSNSPVLDIGCGTGAWLNRLSNLGYTNLHGIDIDRNSFRLEGIDFTVANIDYDHPRFEKQFSLITAIEVLEHLENIGSFFKFISENLSAEGTLLLTTPNIHSLTCKTRFMLTGNMSQFDEKGDVDHIYPVLQYPIQKIMTRYNLIINELWSFPELGGVKGSRLITKIGSNVLRLFIKDDLPGDTLCFFIKKIPSY